MSQTVAPRPWYRLSGGEFAWAAALPVVLAGILYWVDAVDFYNRHFFDHGAIVFANNLVRIVFLCLLCWLIYAPGAAVSTLLLRGVDRTDVTPVERAVLGFGIGIGLWHVFMLVLGHAGLYYRSVVGGIAALVVVVSCAHFGRVAHALAKGLRDRAVDVPRPRSFLDRVSLALIVGSIVWLLVARGLYPGGGGDYYTHYFYYNLAVLKNHGLAPNDVWYHFFYSQGYGLHFLGMLLTDPEAPGLATFGCIVFAAVAMAAFAYRLAPGSLWPACVAVPYLVAYIASIHLGGDFQKGHEQMAALIVMAVIGLCMMRGPAGRAWLFMAASCCVAVATIAQPFGMVVGCYFLLLAIWFLATRQRAAMWGVVFAGAAIAATIVGIFGVTYWKTGLLNDQGLDLMLRVADIERLDRWGVLPQIILAAWIRDNYVVDAPTPDLPAYFEMLSTFMRLGQFWVYLGLAVALVLLVAAERRFGWRSATADLSGHRIEPVGPVTPATAMAMVGGFVAMAAVLSMILGASQSTSFERASSFFFPLLLLLALATCTWASSRSNTTWIHRSFAWQQPLLLFVGTLVLWTEVPNWKDRVAKATGNGLSLFVGRYSVADAFTRLEDKGLPFGGIHPRALAAAQQLPLGTRIWSTTVDSYCMAPNCWIESVVSFKTSSKLDEILTAPPERAKQLLHEAGLDYFLVIEGAFMLDVLPYSRLFAPETIGQYLGIKWTDGVAFLLTWKGPDTTPITPEFLAIYRKEMEMAASHRWFRLRTLIPFFTAAMENLRSKPWGAAANFPWRAPQPAPPDGTLNILEASYGENCRDHVPWAPAKNRFRPGNLTQLVRDMCSGETSCSHRVNLNLVPDPVSGCDKDIVVTYRCRADEPARRLRVPPQREMTINLGCQ